MIWLFLLPFILILLYSISIIFSILSSGLIPAYIFFISFLAISLYGVYLKKKKKINNESEIIKSNAELKVADKEEECPNCHKMSEKKFNACEYCAAIKH